MTEETPRYEVQPDDEQPGALASDGASRPGGLRRVLGRFRRGRPDPEAEAPSLAAFDLDPHVDLQPARRAPGEPVEAAPAPPPDSPAAEVPAEDIRGEHPVAEELPEEELAEDELAEDARIEVEEDPADGTGEDTEDYSTPAGSTDLAAAAVLPPSDDDPARVPAVPAAPTIPATPGEGRTEGDDADAPVGDAADEALVAASVDAAADAGPAVARRVRPRRAEISAPLVVLTGLATTVILAFLLIEPSPRWVLLLGAAAVVVGLDGTLRQTWREPFSIGAETAPFLFVPALYMLAVPVVIEHNIPGELVVVVGLLAGAGFGALAWAETASVRPMAPEYDLGRVLVTAGTYIAGFAVFSLTYVFDISLPTAILAVGLASTMLAVEVLREGEIDPQETLGFALVTGVIMAEARLLMYYVPLDTYLAGLTLLLGFYLLTGLLHSHVTRAFSWALSVEYGGIATAGLALVVAARMVGLA